MITAPGNHSAPVYSGYFADPFIWKHQDTYYAVGTGETEATGRAGVNVFPLLQSGDFFRWEFAGFALPRPERSLGNSFWAPAVAHSEDAFYLYYSVGHGDKQHQLRVALSPSPTGPYYDMGVSLLNFPACPFAIDAHPFKDDGGQWYLFYARDFLDCDGGLRAGTGLVAARMATMTSLENEGRTILRARCDWQRFESERSMYGQVWDWHTLEGPCVHKHQGRYYCFYSGGRWENDSYGVDYGVSENILGPYDDSGNETGPRVLRTVPGKLIGPGHNTVISGPDGRTLFIVYHAWDAKMTARRMFISPLVWTPQGPRCVIS